MAWSPDGKTIAIGAFDETIVIDADSHHELARVGESRGWNYVSFLPDGRLITQGNSDAVPAAWKAVVWEARTGTQIQVLHAPAACATDSEVAWACRPGGAGYRGRYERYRERLVVEKWDGAAVSTGWIAKDRPPMYQVVVAMAPSGAGAITGGSAYSAIETERMLVHTTEQTPAGEQRMYFYKDVPKSVSGGFVRIYHGGRFHCERLGIGERIVSAVFASDSDHLLAGDKSGAVFLLSRDCALLGTLAGGHDEVTGVAFGPGRAVGVSKGELRWWDLATHELTAIDSFPAR